MLVRPQSRSRSALTAMYFLLLAPFAASANPLDDQTCQRLRTELQALTVLGIDKQVEKGAVWAKERLTVADLNLVKRYLDVFEQIKFRCEKIVALVEPEEKDEDDDEDGAAAGGASPPIPERKNAQPVKSPAAPAVAPLVTSNTAAKAARAPLSATKAGAAQMAPARADPPR